MVFVKKIYRTAPGRIFQNMSDFTAAAMPDEGSKPAEPDLAVQEYYDEFKALNQQGGMFLLLKDFASIYTECDQNLFENWLTVRPKIIDLDKKRNDTMLKEIMKDIDHASDEVMDVAAFIAIPLLMTTANVTKTKSKKSKGLWRPSKREVQEGFITHVKTAAVL